MTPRSKQENSSYKLVLPFLKHQLYIYMNPAQRWQRIIYTEPCLAYDVLWVTRFLSWYIYHIYATIKKAISKLPNILVPKSHED